MKQISEFQLAWAAGLIDGEGCIRIYRSSKGRQSKGKWNRSAYHQLQLIVGMTSCAAIEKLYSIFECGSISTTRKKDKWNQIWTWNVSGQTAGKILEQLLPYFVVKKAEAELGLQFLKSKSHEKGGQLLPQNVIDARDKFYNEMRVLKPRNQLSYAR